jgi:hypothetical protein
MNRLLQLSHLKTTMPDGQKYEDWLKSKDRGENGRLRKESKGR